MTDDSTGAEPKVFSAAFADPYVLLVRDDLSIMILKADESGDLDEIEQGEAIRETKWLSGSLYEDANDVLRLESDDDNEEEAGNVLLFLLTSHGGLEVGLDCSQLPHSTRRYAEVMLGLPAAKPQQACVCRQRPWFPASIFVY
jgi:hypothetical protein